MAKISLNKPTAGYNLAAINENFTKLETEFQDKVLYRNNTSGEANTLETDLDINGKRLLNLTLPLTLNEAARLQDVQNAIAGGAANLITSVPAGNLAATNVQVALNELDTEKASLVQLALKTDTSSLAASTGASLIGSIQSGTGAVATTVQSKLRESVSVFDYMSSAEISDVLAGTGLLNVFTAVQTAINSTAVTNKTLELPDGVYRLDSALTSTTNFQNIVGGGVKTVLWGNHTGYVLQVGNGVTERVGIGVENLHFWSPTGKGFLSTQANKSRFRNLWAWCAGTNFTLRELSIIDGCENFTASSNLYGYIRAMYPALPAVVSTDVGILIDRPTIESNAVTLTNPVVEGVASHGIKITGTHVVITLINPMSEGNGGWGYYFDGDTGYLGNLTLLNSYAEANTLGSLYAKKQFRMQVLGGNLGSSAGANVSLVDVQNSLFSNVAVWNLTEDAACGTIVGNIYLGNSVSGTFTRNDAELGVSFDREGAWTPSVGGTATYTSQIGRYVRVGKVVHVWGVLIINAIGTGSSTVISGLPFTIRNTPIVFAGSVGYFESLQNNYIFLATAGNNNTKTLQFSGTTALAASATMPATIIGNGTRIDFQLTYEIA